MGIERRIGHTKKEEGNAFLFFRPEAAEGGMAEQGLSDFKLYLRLKPSKTR